MTNPPPWLPQQLPPLLEYSGEDQADTEETFEEWLEQVELVADLLKWDEPTRLVHLVTRLQGQARTFYRSCPATVWERYSSLVKELKQRFQPVRLSTVQTSAFHSRQQRERESVDEYAQDLRHLFHRAYPAAKKGNKETEEVCKVVLTNQFVVGRAPAVKEKLAGAEGTFKELLTKACFEEAKAKDLSRTRREPACQGSIVTERRSTDHERGPRAREQPGDDGRYETSSRTGAGYRNRGQWVSHRPVCHHCRSDQHFIWNCPLKGRAEPQEPRGGGKGHQESASVSGLQSTTLETAVKRAAADLATIQWKNGPTVKAAVTFEGLRVMATVDTGATVSIVALPFLLQALKAQRRPEQTPEEWERWAQSRWTKTPVTVNTFGGDTLPISNQIEATIVFGNHSKTAPVLIMEESPIELLLGTDFFAALRLLPMGVQLLSGEMPFQPTKEAAVRLLVTAKIPARHGRVVRVKVDKGHSGEGVFLPKMNSTVGCDQALLTVPESRETAMVFWNLGYSPVVLTREVLGTLEPVEEQETITCPNKEDDTSSRTASEVNGSVNDLSVVAELTEQRELRLCQSLNLQAVPNQPTLEERDALTQLVLEYHDIFALDDSELGTTHLVEHEIHTGDSRPIK